MPDARDNIDLNDVATLVKIISDLPDLLNKKMAAYDDLYKWRQQRPKDVKKLQELLVENIVDDIAWIGKVRHMIGADPTPPLGNMSVEGLKLVLLAYLGAIDPSELPSKAKNVESSIRKEMERQQKEEDGDNEQK